MAESHLSYEEALNELYDLQAMENRTNVMILYKDKEIAQLKAQLADIEDQIKLNRSSYAKNNTQAVLLHPMVNQEFETIRQELLETHEKASSLSMDNYFKKLSEANPPSALNQLVKFLEKTSADVTGEISEEKMTSLIEEIEKEKSNNLELEKKLKDSRELVSHLEEEIEDMQDLISSLTNKIEAVDAECEELKKSNPKLSGKLDGKSKRNK
ncbi:unnamed protein product [Blepharisma stoltei]|uniref:Uncharacterized protein n=1 Tax=Blepharisma stoltei TaxID=1481888 RepID=A0AAU9IP91_9CILI|nr:unnamed protein product [Blepharisma stoltei]